MGTGIQKGKKVWKEVSTLRFLIPLLAGILAEGFFPTPKPCTGIVFIIPMGIGFFGVLTGNFHLSDRKWIYGLFIQLAFFSFGRFVRILHQDTSVLQSRYFNAGQSPIFLATIISDPVRKSKSWKSEVEIRWISDGKTCFRSKEKIFLYTYGNNSNSLQRGVEVAFRKNLKPIENNPSFPQFDYKQFCRFRHIYHQVFLTSKDFRIVKTDTNKSIPDQLSIVRKKLLAIIIKHIPSKTESGFLEALLLGFTDDLDPQLLKAYANSGVIHIIAISGLHLALIFHILQFLLRKLERKNGGRWLKILLVLSGLWFYSFLSGASPSVIRAASMFSLTLLARSLLREVSIFNTLSMSAFLLICFDPFWIWDTGFQLSYSAVLGLGLFARPIQLSLTLRNKILKNIWGATAVSISAQLLTTPLSIYYFHQFPVFFLFANLLAVPLSSLILLVGIMLCLFSFSDTLSNCVGWLLEYLIQILNNTVTEIARLPGAVVSDLSLSIPAMILIYSALFSFSRLILIRKKVRI